MKNAGEGRVLIMTSSKLKTYDFYRFLLISYFEFLIYLLRVFIQ